MEQSPRLSLSYVMPAQAQKHVTVNETFRRLDALTQLTVRSQTAAAEPGAPSEGDAYILPASPTGTIWVNYTTGNIAAFQDGTWVEIVVSEGFRAWVSDDDALVVFDGSVWAQVSGGGSSETAAKFGVNTTADTTNRLSVKTDAVLFSHDDVTPGNDDCLVKVNKKVASDTASHLFQTGFSGRAEIGLTGDDDFHIRMSTDGSTFFEGLKITNAVTPFVSFPIINSRLGIGVDNPLATLHLESTGPSFKFRDTNGTGDSQTGFMGFYDSGDVLKSLFGFASGSNSDVDIRNAYAASLIFRTTNLIRMEIEADGSVIVGSPTGGGKGLGTINAKAVYDDNVLLSCYVFDQAVDGSIDLDKWDGKVPNHHTLEETELTVDPDTGKPINTVVKVSEEVVRKHAPAGKFKARIKGEYDPLTLDGYAKHWQDNKHLSAMPDEATYDPVDGTLSTGEWIQRLVETVEVQAVLIEQLNQHVKQLMAEGSVRPV